MPPDPFHTRRDGCSCPDVHTLVASHLEEVELELCPVHQADEIAERDRQAAEAAYERDGAVVAATVDRWQNQPDNVTPLNAPLSAYGSLKGFTETTPEQTRQWNREQLAAHRPPAPPSTATRERVLYDFGAADVPTTISRLLADTDTTHPGYVPPDAA